MNLFDFSFLNTNEYGNDIKLIYEVDAIIQTEGLGYFLSSEMNEKINHLKESLYRIYSDKRIKALFVPSDSTFWERILIFIFNKLNKPTFEYLHGLPALYRNHYCNYLLVWSKKIKENFINIGYPDKKLFVLSNLKYDNNFKEMKEMDLTSVLVLSYSIMGANSTNDVSITIPRDFGVTLLYPELVKNVLLKFGVKKALFRPHPSENPYWYAKNIDTSFYEIDTSTTEDKVLKNTSLVIGPTSTMLLNSLYYGTPYILFEPKFDDEEFSPFNLVPPFDGTDPYVPLCRTEDELYSAIKEKKCASQELYYEYNDYSDELQKIVDIIKGIRHE